MQERILLVATAVLAAAAPQPSKLSPSEASAIADRAYTYAYPLVLMEFTRRAGAGAAPASVTESTNRFNHLAEFPNAKFRAVIRPNADTLYSSAWLDVSKEPVLLHVPDTKDRYYLMQLMDAWTETIAAPGKRTSGTGEGWFAIVGPDWKGTLPARAQRIAATTNMLWLLGRTQTNSAADYPFVHAIQKGYTLMPLRLYPDGPPASSAPPPARPAAGGARPPIQVERLDIEEFFRIFAELLAANPPHADDGAMVRDLARLGIVPGKPFDASSLGAEQRKALREGAAVAAGRLAKLTGALARPGPTGWTGGAGNVGRYGADYQARANVARIGLGANPPEDAVYLHCDVDAASQALTGAKRYLIHYEKSQLPPVRAFWSTTVYNDDGYFTENALNRYAIGDRDALKYNADGSLDLYLQHSSPGSAMESNWLPTPEGAFNLSLRLYWPKDEILGGKWIPPAVRER
jgi:hypothetical protein